MKKHKIGVIGLGARGESFARQLYEGTERAELFGLCDISEDRIRKFCDHCEIRDAATWSDPEEFFAQEELEGVIVATPDFTHLEVVQQAAAAGKHVFVEKPMEVTLERCHALMRAVRDSGVQASMGFNMRASPHFMKLKEVVASGVLGQIVHIDGLEFLAYAHGAAFMRRFHRRRARSGGLINTKSSHDMDLMQWLIGHEHRLKRVAAFGGTNVFKPEKAPAKYCHECPRGVWRDCAYRDRAGFVFPVGGEEPIHHEDAATYGEDLCVYNDDKDICDNMTVILEWDSGIRGSFNLQMFGAKGCRHTRIWGEKGYLDSQPTIRVTEAPHGDEIEFRPKARAGGHGGADPHMIGRFVDLLEGNGPGDSGLEAGLAASIMALKAEEAMVTGKIIEIDPALYI